MFKKKLMPFAAVALAAVLLAGILAIPGVISASPDPAYMIGGAVADPPTYNQTGFVNTPRVHDGRIWTDKSVEVISGTNDFKVTLSALSQTFQVVEGYEIPADTVLIIDVSGSMIEEPNNINGRSRLSVLIDALNEAIGILLDANPLNRVAVVAYGGGAPGTGYARVENVLALGRYTPVTGKFFSVAGATVAVNATPDTSVVSGGERIINSLVASGSTPTQWGIYEGAKILIEAKEKTVDVPVIEEDGSYDRDVTVTRRPNIILMTDGEPTIGWLDYEFNDPPARAEICPSGVEKLSPVAPGKYFGDGSYGEMGVSLLTVLTAAHRKLLVHKSYFPGASAEGVSGQPQPAVGFYTIGIGNQPSQAATNLIRATMNPFGTPAGKSAVNVDAVDADVRRGMDLGNTGIFKQNPNAATYNPIMGDLLRSFAAAPTTPILFHAARRNAFTDYRWDAAQVSVKNTPGLTLTNLNFADRFYEAASVSELREAFQSITTSIQGQSLRTVTNVANPEDVEFDGWLVFSDVLGEFMEFKGVTGFVYNGVEISRAGFGAAIKGNTGGARTNLEATLLEHFNYGNLDPSKDVKLTQVQQLISYNISQGNLDLPGGGKITYYAEPNRDFRSIDNADGGAAVRVDLYPMIGTLVEPHIPPGGGNDLMHIAFHVITVLKPGKFSEVFVAAAPGLTPMERDLKKGDQFIRWYIPASLIPMRSLDQGGVLLPTSQSPIRVRYTVGLDMARVDDAVASGVIPSDSGKPYYFYSNRVNEDVTLAFYQPGGSNPYYNNSGYAGSSDIDRAVMKTSNPTGTMTHVSLNRHTVENASRGSSAVRTDMHWLGNNGRLTLTFASAPEPPELGNLTILKTFTGLPADFDVFDHNKVRPITFLVVGTDSTGVEIFRKVIEFTAENFKWNSAQGRYEFTLSNLPLGNYLVFEAGGNVEGYVAKRPGPPQTADVGVPGAHVTVSFVNEYTPSPPVPPEELPALTVIKVFHGLAGAEKPAGFRMRITGPGGFDETLNLVEAEAGQTFTNLATGEYTIAEIKQEVPGADLGDIKVNGEKVTIPYSFTIADATAHITIHVDNNYSHKPPPPPTTPPTRPPTSPPPTNPPTTTPPTNPPTNPPTTPPTKPPTDPPDPGTPIEPPDPPYGGREPPTGDGRDAWIAIAAVVFGLGCVGMAEVYRRSSKKAKNTQD